MKLKKEKLRIANNRGITLVALVVTIVILIILAAISINALFGDEGIIKQADKSKAMTANAEKYEEEKLQEIDDKIANAIVKTPSTPETQITFYIIANNGTKEYIVDEGTTWEEFIKDQNPEDAYAPLFDLSNFSSSIEDRFGAPVGHIFVSGGGPVYEGSNIDDGLWVFPTDVPKNGCYYTCTR